MEPNSPDSKVCVANMGPTWVLSAPVGPHVGPTNITIREYTLSVWVKDNSSYDSYNGTAS